MLKNFMKISQISKFTFKLEDLIKFNYLFWLNKMYFIYLQCIVAMIYNDVGMTK